MRIMFGAVVSLPPFSAGRALNWLHHVVGLSRLGHDVYYVEEIDDQWLRDERGRPSGSTARKIFEATMAGYGMTGKACQLSANGEPTAGLSRKQLDAVSRKADLLINVSGHVKQDWILGNVAKRVYLDQDPVYTQLWHTEYGAEMGLRAHDVFVTVGLNIGTRHSPIPDCGLEWHHTLPPVILNGRPAASRFTAARFTTIASWNAYGDLRYQGKWYRAKYREFERLRDLPKLVDHELEVAFTCASGEEKDVMELADHGWHLRDARSLDTLPSYRRYIAASSAELGIAKNAYVRARSGWFSDRAAHYLAAGRPVLAQSTGFERHLPTGRGLLAFKTLDDAAAGIEEIATRYKTHSRAAGEIAEEHLDYRKVLPALLAACGA
jgi:hypothetical protein